MSAPIDRVPGGGYRGAIDGVLVPYVDAARRLAELRDASVDPFLPRDVREACLGLLEHLAGYERWVDERFPVAPPGWLTSLEREVEPHAVVAAIMLRRLRAGCDSPERVLATFTIFRRAIVRALARETRP